MWSRRSANVTCGPKTACESDRVESVNEPFRWIEVVPSGSVPIVAWVHMVVVVVALAKCNKRDPPTIPAGIFRAVWLITPNMADGVNAKRRVQNRKGTADSRE